MKNKKRCGAFICLLSFIIGIVPLMVFVPVNANALSTLKVLSVTYAGNTGSAHSIKVKFDQRIDNGALDVTQNSQIVNNIKLNGKPLSEIIASAKDSALLYVGVNTDKTLLDIYVYNSLPIGIGMNNFVNGKTDVFEFCSGLALPNGVLQTSQQFIRRDNTVFYEGITIDDVTSVLIQPTTYDFQIKMSKPISDQNIGIELQNLGTANYIKLNGKTIPEINQNAKDKSGNPLTNPVVGYVWDDGTGQNWIMYIHISKELSLDRNLKFDGTDTLEILPGFDALQGLKYTVIDTQKRVFTGLFDNYWVNPAEMTPKSDLNVSSVSALTISKDFTSFYITFDRNITDTMKPNLNNPMWWLSWRAVTAPSLFKEFSNKEMLWSLYNQKVIDSVRNKIKINGKTIYELMLLDKGSAYENDSVFVNMGETNNTVSVYIKNASNAAALCGGGSSQEDMNIEILKGFSTVNNQATAKDAEYIYRFQYGVTFETDKQPSVDEVNIVSLMPIRDLTTSYATQIRFSKSAANLVSDCSATYPVKKYIKINGKTIEEFNNLKEKNVEAFWNDNGTAEGGKDGYFVLHLFISKEVTAENGGIKLDGTDNIEVVQGFVLPLGGEIKTSEKNIFGKSNVWFKEGQDPSLETIKVSSLMNFVDLGTNYATQIKFSKSAANAETECASTAAVKQIKINGKTIEELNALQAKNVEAYWKDNTNADGSKDGYYVLHLFISKNILGEQGGIKLDGSDFIEVPKGFEIPAGGSIKETVKNYYSKYGSWYSEGNAPKEDTVKVENIMGIVDLKTTYATQIRFSKSAAITTTECANSPAVRDFVKINGKTIGEINKAYPKAIEAYWNDNGDAQGIKDNYFVLHLFISKTLPKDFAGIKMDAADTIEVMNGFVLPNNGIIKERELFTYKYRDSTWIKKGTVQPLFSKVDILECAGFNAVTENHQIIIKFNSTVSFGWLPHMNADSSWLKAISNMDKPVFYYSEASLKSYIEYGVQDSLRDKVFINGKSIWDLMIADDPTMKNVTIICTYGDNGSNSLSMMFNDKGINAIDITKKYEITFLKGFITPAGGMLEEDVKLIYNPQTKKWSKNTEETNAAISEQTVVKDTNNWNLPAVQTSSISPVLLIVFSALLLIFVAAFLILLKLKNKAIKE